MNSNTTSTIKKFAREAKQRLTANNYKNIITQIKCQESLKTFYLNGRMLTKEEMYNLYQKVAEIQNSQEFVINPLVRLADISLLEKMNRDQQESYMFNISAIYCALKRKYEEDCQLEVKRFN